MLKNILVFLFLFSLPSYAQVETKPIIYLNENLEQIDQISFSEKVLKSIYRENTTTHDSVIVKSLFKTYDFGSFKETELLQVKDLLRKYLNVKDFDKNLILVFKDSLLGYTHYSKSIQNRRNIDETDIISEKEYIKRRQYYDSRQKKCKKFAKKNNATPLYTYSENIDFNFKSKYHNKYKLPDVIKSIFFKNVKRGHIILKPNGQYFYYSFLTQAQVKKMLESDWKPFIKDFNTVKSDPKKYSLEFIEKMYEDFENEMRVEIMRHSKQSKKEKGTPNITSGRITPPNCFTHASF
ncbi:hypothetical protein FBALC1_06563 [Flavobacteriales bacterium ALC-1]|nr:hypothetical protein FBALC1_06563 [Flavobacteriales bacterium ALC-1]